MGVGGWVEVKRNCCSRFGRRGGFCRGGVEHNRCGRFGG